MPSHFLQARIFLPSSSNRYPMRGAALVAEDGDVTALIGMSLSMMPAAPWPCSGAGASSPLTPSTMAQFESGVRVIAPSFPTSCPSTRELDALTQLQVHLRVPIHHRTSGASETMRMNRRSRSLDRSENAGTAR
jgi:hypothetical protein